MDTYMKIYKSRKKKPFSFEEGSVKGYYPKRG